MRRVRSISYVFIKFLIENSIIPNVPQGKMAITMHIKGDDFKNILSVVLIKMDF